MIAHLKGGGQLMGAVIAKLLSLGAIAIAAPVINEIHYNPPENPVRLEFVEIYNPGPAEINLGGWRPSYPANYLS